MIHGRPRIDRQTNIYRFVFHSGITLQQRQASDVVDTGGAAPVSYYLLHNRPIFVSTVLHERFKREALVDKGAVFRAGMLIEGDPHAAEANRLFSQWIERLFAADPSAFELDVLCFEMAGKVAAQNCWSLLYDYCHYFRRGRIESAD